MSLLIQKKPEFKTRREIVQYLKQKEESLLFWSSLKTIDMSELIADLRKDIEELQKKIAEWK